MYCLHSLLFGTLGNGSDQSETSGAFAQYADRFQIQSKKSRIGCAT